MWRKSKKLAAFHQTQLLVETNGPSLASMTSPKSSLTRKLSKISTVDSDHEEDNDESLLSPGSALLDLDEIGHRYHGDQDHSKPITLSEYNLLLEKIASHTADIGALLKMVTSASPAPTPPLDADLNTLRSSDSSVVVKTSPLAGHSVEFFKPALFYSQKSSTMSDGSAPQPTPMSRLQWLTPSATRSASSSGKRSPSNASTSSKKLSTPLQNRDGGSFMNANDCFVKISQRLSDLERICGLVQEGVTAAVAQDKGYVVSAMSDNSDLQLRVERLTSSLSELQLRHEKVCTELAESERNVADSTSCVESLRNLVLDMKAAMDSHTTLSDGLAAQLSSVHLQHTESQEQLDVMRMQHSELTEQLNSLHDKASQHSALEQLALLEVAEVKRRCQQLEQALTETTTALVGAKSVEGVLREQVHALSKEAESFVQARDSLDKSSEALSYELHQTNTALCSVQHENERLSLDYQQSLEDNTCLASRAQELEVEKRYLETRCNELAKWKDDTEDRKTQGKQNTAADTTDSFKQALEVLNTELHQAKLNLLAAEGENERLGVDYQRLSEEKTQCESILQELQGEKHQQERLVRELSAEKDKFREELLTLSHLSEQYEKRIAQLTHDLKDALKAAADVDTLMSRVSAAEMTLSFVQNEKEESVLTCQRLAEEKGRLMDRIQELEQEKLSVYRRDEELKAARRALAEEKRVFAQDKDTFQQSAVHDMRVKQTEFEVTGTELIQTKTSLSVLQAEHVKMETDYQRLIESTSPMQTRVEELEETRYRLESCNEELRNRNTFLTEDNVAVTKEKENLEQKIVAMMDTNEMLVAEVQQVKSTMGTVQGEKEDRTRQCQRLTEVNNLLEQDKQLLEERVENLKSVYDIVAAEKLAISQERDQHAQSIARIHQEAESNDSYRHAHEALNVDLQQTKSNLRDVECEKELLAVQYKQLVEEKTQLEGRIGQVGQENQQLQKRNDVLQKEKVLSEERIRELTQELASHKSDLLYHMENEHLADEGMYEPNSEDILQGELICSPEHIHYNHSSNSGKGTDSESAESPNTPFWRLHDPQIQALFGNDASHPSSMLRSHNLNGHDVHGSTTYYSDEDDHGFESLHSSSDEEDEHDDGQIKESSRGNWGEEQGYGRGIGKFSQTKTEFQLDINDDELLNKVLFVS
jgi:chromosome segregation ATPase